MLTKRIIACLDVTAGRVVKGIKFLNLRDAGDPAELAASHSANGADEVVLLDISATHENRETLVDTVRRTAKELFIPFTVGGGIRTLQNAGEIFDAGADKVSINSAAIADPTLITQIATASAHRRPSWRLMLSAPMVALKSSPTVAARRQGAMLSSGPKKPRSVARAKFC